MINRELLKKIIEDKLEKTDCFVVNLSVSEDNNVILEIDSETSVSLDFCAELSRFIEQKLDREKEDFSLEVGSYSISKPFVDFRQYVKNIGRKIEVLTLESKKIRGVLIEANTTDFMVETEEKILLEGQKRKKLIKKEILFSYNNIKHTKLDF